MCIEEAWKAIMGTQMATYMLELWKTARKHRTAAMVVTQELKDITSSPIIKDSIVENSGVKILLDQTKYVNRFEELAGQLSLSDDDKAMVLSLNRFKMPGRAWARGILQPWQQKEFCDAAGGVSGRAHRVFIGQERQDPAGRCRGEIWRIGV